MAKHLRLSKKKKFLLSVLIPAILLLFVFLPITDTVVEFTFRYLASQKVDKVKQLLADDKKDTLRQAQEISRLDKVTGFIEKNDAAGLTSALTEEKEKRQISSITAINKDGVALAQIEPSLEQRNRGDVVFLNSSIGQKVSLGKSIAAIETSKTFPLMVTGAVPIKKENKVVGGIIVGQFFNQEYVQLVEQKISAKNSQLLFYSKEVGALGDTFGSEETTKQLVKYFNAGSDWVSGNKISGQVQIDGKIYHVRNTKLPGLQKDVGGFLIFYPYASQFSEIFGSFITTLLFVFLVLVIHRRMGSPLTAGDFWRQVAVIGLAVFVVSYAMENMLLNIHLSHTEKPVSPIYNSVLFLEPDWNIYEQNYEQHIAVKIATGGEAINAVKVTLNYDPSAVKVLDLLMNQSFCNKQFILEKVIDNNKGQVVLACGLPASGFSDHFATVTELLVKPLKAGSFNLRFGEGKSVLVLANDGLGTNVLRRTTNGSYRVSVAPTKTGSVATSSPSRTNANSDQAKKESEKLPLILVSSLTHPNSERWFSSRDIYFNWLHTSDEHYVYLFNQQPDSTLIDGKHMSRNSIKVTAWTDGVYYFHLATENNGVIGPVSHYKVMIDSAPPESLNIKASQTKIKTGEIVRFKLEGNDKMSGLQPTFYLKVDEETFLPVPSDPVISFDSSGKHIITARVFDNAGNIKNTSVEIKVEARSTFERSMTAISGWLMHLYSRTKLLI